MGAACGIELVCREEARLVERGLVKLTPPLDGPTRGSKKRLRVHAPADGATQNRGVQSAPFHHRQLGVGSAESPLTILPFAASPLQHLPDTIDDVIGQAWLRAKERAWR